MGGNELKFEILFGVVAILLALIWWVKWLMKNRVADVKKEDLFFTWLILVAACAWIVFFCGDAPPDTVMACPAPKIYAAHLFVCSLPDKVNLRVSCESTDYIVKQENIQVTIYKDGIWWRDAGEVGCSEVRRIHSVSYPHIKFFDVDEYRIADVVDKMSALSGESGVIECTIGFDYGINVRVLEYLAYNPIKRNCSSGWKLIRNATFVEQVGRPKQEYVGYEIGSLGDSIREYLRLEEERYNYWSLDSNVWKRMYKVS